MKNDGDGRTNSPWAVSVMQAKCPGFLVETAELSVFPQAL